jgi:hypothetical protein
VQRTLSSGSSGAGNPSAWTYSDIYHLKVREMRGDFGVPGFDASTRMNFLHGHGREPAIRVAWEIAMGAWAGETGMMVDRDVWRHLPEGRWSEPIVGIPLRGGVPTTESTDSAQTSVADDSRETAVSCVRPGARSDETTAAQALEEKTRDRERSVRGSAAGQAPKAYPSSHPFARRTRPEGHKHTSPDGVCVLPWGVFHSKWFAQEIVSGRATRKGLVEIKAPGYKVMQRRGRSYTRVGWQKEPLLPKHLPVYYYMPQVTDQASVLGTWCGPEDTSWVDFVPMWIAHSRVGPQPFIYTAEVLSEHAVATEAPELARRWFVSTVAARKGSTAHAWVTAEMLVTRVMRNDLAVEAMSRFYYDYYRDINGTHEPPRKHHEPWLGPDGREIVFTYLPLKQVLWVVHPTREVPPVPSEWALNTYGFTPRPHQVQSVTRPLTRHDTSYPVAPKGWPKSVPWCNSPEARSTSVVPGQNGYHTCYIVHMWDVKPMYNTLSQMSSLK